MGSQCVCLSFPLGRQGHLQWLWFLFKVIFLFFEQDFLFELTLASSFI